MSQRIVLLFLVFCIFMAVGCVPNAYKKSNELSAIHNKSYLIAKSGIDANTKEQKLPKNWKKIIISSIENFLKDPDSAKYKFDGNPQIASFSNVGRFRHSADILSYESPMVGYTGIVWVNAKNSYGGYTGGSPWWYIISGGEVKLLANNQYGVWTSRQEIASHMGRSYLEALLFK